MDVLSMRRFWNESDRLQHAAGNATAAPQELQRNYFAMLYSLLILAIVFGNVLVCMAVLRERSLQTTTNYLVVSLAVADLLVASLVMPWAVYLEVVGGDWMFGRVYCNIFVTLDVMMCTASILNLCAISIDRYTAVVMPVLYNTSHSSRKRVSLMIVTVWTLAFAVSCPLLFGFNTTDNPSICSISNPDFVIYSSVVSFYLPFAVTLLVYVRIYVFLRKRRKKIAFRQASGRVQLGGDPPSMETCLQGEAAKERRDLSPIRIKVETTEQPAPPTPGFLAACILRKKPRTAPSENKLLPLAVTQNYCSVSHASFAHTENQAEHEEDEDEEPTTKRSCEVQNMSNGRTRTSLRPALRLSSGHCRNKQAREKKATQMLAIVLGVFLVCWLPFFVIHILNTHCSSCHVPPELYSATTWLGYVNSALNPVIYTTFNIEFRRAFIKILRC